METAITIKNLTDTSQVAIAVTDGSQVSVADKVLTINPTANLTADKLYAIQIATGAVKDLSDNPFAGITNDTLMLRMDESQWDSVMDTNLKSVFNMTKQCIKVMLRQKYGSLIHMSSVVGIFGNAGQANYAASKAGIIGFSKSIPQMGCYGFYFS